VVGPNLDLLAVISPAKRPDRWGDLEISPKGEQDVYPKAILKWGGSFLHTWHLPCMEEIHSRKDWGEGGRRN